jgi:hypothetical protein
MAGARCCSRCAAEYPPHLEEETGMGRSRDFDFRPKRREDDDEDKRRKHDEDEKKRHHRRHDEKDDK